MQLGIKIISWNTNRRLIIFEMIFERTYARTEIKKFLIMTFDNIIEKSFFNDEVYGK